MANRLQNLGVVMRNTTSKEFFWGLLGISFVVLIHEMGHFLAAHWADVATPIFSIGFGPRLAGFAWGKTFFQLSALPIGGYVEISPIAFAAQSYPVQLFIVLAGIGTNILFSLIVFYVVGIISCSNCSWPLRFAHPLRRAVKLCQQDSLADDTQTPKGLVGPLGIIRLGGQAAGEGLMRFFLFLAVLSANLAFFNLLPIPFFDGGKLVFITIQQWWPHPPELLIGAINFIFFIFLLLFFFWVTKKDIERLKKD